MIIPPAMLAWRRALQFSPDSSLEQSWFRSYEASLYGGENSIDLRVEPIDRPSGSYDLISLSMVLEFIPEDRRAFSELVRIGSDSCILHLTFTSDLTDSESTHTEKPVGEFGHYHDYGLDFERWLSTADHGLSTLAAEIPDPVTGDSTHKFCFFCRRRNDAETLASAFEAELPGSVPLLNLLPE